MKKKILATLLTGLVLGTSLVGCGKTEGAEAGKKLVVSTWGLNEDVLKETVFEPFAKEHGVEIVLDIGNNSERLTKIKNNPNSQIDITYLAESFAEQGVEAGIFDKLDYSKIPNASEMNEKAKSTVEAGYGPAYTLNSIGIVVDPSAGIEINSWEDLWKPELKNKIAIPDITTTNGPAMVEIAAEKAGVDVKTDNGEAAFKELEALKPNVVKTYSKSSDLANMFSNGEIVAAVASDFAFGTISKAKPEVINVIPESGTYLNFNTININKNSKNKDLAYEFINYALSKEVQEKTAKALNESPVNKEVKLSEEENKEYICDAALAFVHESMKKKVSDVINTVGEEKLEVISDALGDKISKKLNTEENIDSIISKLNCKISSFNSYEEIIKVLFNDYENILIDNIDSMISQIVNNNQLSGEISKIIEKVFDKFLQNSLNDICYNKQNLENSIMSILDNLYNDFVENKSAKVLEIVDISSIVEEQINAFEVDYAEEIIIGIANKELKAITWLGALLGGILGILSPLLSTIYM